MIKRILFALAFTCLFVFAAAAQQQTAPTRTIVYVGHLLDVKSGKTLANQQIVIEGDKILSVGPSAGPGAKAGYNIIDLSKATVLPGLIDAHVHLTFRPDDLGYTALGISIPREALIGARNAKVTLDAGFTTFATSAANGYTDVDSARRLNSAMSQGPHARRAAQPLALPAATAMRTFSPFIPPSGEGVADGIAAVQQKVRQNIKYGADVIKYAPLAAFSKATTRRLRSTPSKK